MSNLEWSFKGAPPPIPGHTVLGCKHEGWSDREKTQPIFSFELLQRCRVGGLCGERHPNAQQVSWYNAAFSNSYGEEWPSRLVCWAYLEAPSCAVDAVSTAPPVGLGPGGENPYEQTLALSLEDVPWGTTESGAAVHRMAPAITRTEEPP